MSRTSTFFKKSIIALRSARGRDTMMFLLFLLISVILWSVLSLNEEEQYDVRLPVKITHVPDSVTLISPGPEALSVSIRGKGTQFLKMVMGQTPTVNIDFRAFRSNSTLHLTSTDLKGLVRNATGSTQVNVVYPDSLSLPFTSHGGFRLPVSVDYKVTAGPQSALLGRPRLSGDTVGVFTTGSAIPENFTAVTTEPIRLLGLDGTTTRRVKLLGPPGSRVIPDSIDITFEVEPLIFKSRKVVIEPINVPDNIKLITFPAQIDIFYMVPMSQYQSADNRFRVVADYKSINPGSKNVKLQLKNVPDKYQNVHLSADSAEYIIERILK